MLLLPHLLYNFHQTQVGGWLASLAKERLDICPGDISAALAVSVCPRPCSDEGVLGCLYDCAGGCWCCNYVSRTRCSTLGLCFSQRGCSEGCTLTLLKPLRPVPAHSLGLWTTISGNDTEVCLPGPLACGGGSHC